MPHPLVTQLRFSRAEFARCLTDISPEDAVIRLMPMNCISWIVGHLASQEQAYWLTRAQKTTPFTDLNELVGYGRPASTPPYAEMRELLTKIQDLADPYLDTLTTAEMNEQYRIENRPIGEPIGTMLLRNIYHYWFHTGEMHAIRQQLGHTQLPDFVGNFGKAGYRSE